MSEETAKQEETEKKPPSAEAGLCAADCSTFVRLRRRKTLVNLEGLLVVSALDEKGARWLKIRKLKLHYKSQPAVVLSYGADDQFHHEEFRGVRRDEDFEQLESILLSNVQAPADGAE